jgi:REP element-mobilizing transposase RayT
VRFRRPTLVSPENIRVRDSGVLPHWEHPDGYYFLTIRLADSLPTHVIDALRQEQRVLLRTIARDAAHPTLAEKDEIARLFHQRLDRYLDMSMGACHLRTRSLAELVANAFRHFDGERYSLLAWVVMPNHAHVVAKLFEGSSLAGVTHSWKSYTSHKANAILQRGGEFWQRESFDRLVRTDEELENVKRYVAENPNRAGLRDWEWVWICGTG